MSWTNQLHIIKVHLRIIFSILSIRGSPWYGVFTVLLLTLIEIGIYLNSSFTAVRYGMAWEVDGIDRINMEPGKYLNTYDHFIAVAFCNLFDGIWQACYTSPLRKLITNNYFSAFQMLVLIIRLFLFLSLRKSLRFRYSWWHYSCTKISARSGKQETITETFY